MTQAHYVAEVDPEALLDPDGKPWRGIRADTLPMSGTPLGLQPTDAIRASWAGRPVGAVESVDVSAVHDGRTLAFRLEWSDADENREMADTTAFIDAGAVALPSVAEAPLVTMGAPGAAVNLWYWRADEESGRHVVAEGIGTSRTLDRELVRTRGIWKEGRWRVVIARALRVQTGEPVVQLRPGGGTQFAVAVWEGGRSERAGLKAFSGGWRTLALAAEK